MPNDEIVVRDEAEADVAVITEVTAAAFAPLEISTQTEHFIIEALRAAGALTLSLVAEAGGRVVGHIAFSPATMSDGTDGWYGLGPVSFLPPEVFFALSFDGSVPHGKVTFHEGFSADGGEGHG